jgi:hypothetical protein
LVAANLAARAREEKGRRAAATDAGGWIFDRIVFTSIVKKVLENVPAHYLLRVHCPMHWRCHWPELDYYFGAHIQMIHKRERQYSGGDSSNRPHWRPPPSRPASVTHSVNFEQRFMPLSFSSAPGGITVRTPSRNQAPPGNYLLFVFNSQGVPSVAKIIGIG